MSAASACRRMCVCVCTRQTLCVYMCEGGEGGGAGRLAESGDGGGGSESLIG